MRAPGPREHRGNYVRLEWFDAATVVGLTAGTSTPDDVIDQVEARIRQVGQTRT